MIYQKEKAFTYKSEHNENQYKGFKGSPLQVGKLDWLRGNLLNIKTKKTVDWVVYQRCCLQKLELHTIESQQLNHLI